MPARSKCRRTYVYGSRVWRRAACHAWPCCAGASKRPSHPFLILLFRPPTNRGTSFACPLVAAAAAMMFAAAEARGLPATYLEVREGGRGGRKSSSPACAARVLVLRPPLSVPNSCGRGTGPVGHVRRKREWWDAAVAWKGARRVLPTRLRLTCTPCLERSPCPLAPVWPAGPRVPCSRSLSCAPPLCPPPPLCAPPPPLCAPPPPPPTLCAPVRLRRL